MKFQYILVLFMLAALSCTSNTEKSNSTESTLTDSTLHDYDTLKYDDEKHLKNVRMLTRGGDNAEAYWSFNNDMLVFQSNYNDWDVSCDQIFYFNPFEETAIDNMPPMISTGEGRTTCAYFMPGDSTVVYASTHLSAAACPPTPERSDKYVWPIYDSYDIFVTDLEGNIVKQLTDEAGYDAEATVSPKGDKIVFTSMRSGDLELYTMNIDGSNVKQITNELGYDGGAFFSPDGSQLIFRSSRPKSKEEVAEYKELLAEGLVQPTEMELFICNADGSALRQLTDLGKANWCPFFHPSGEKVIFASNHETERGFPFNLYMINTDGTGLEQVTHDSTFDAFPMFSPNGKYLVFGSNRHNGGTRDTNLFMAEWVD